MRVKSLEQQALQGLQRIRSLWMGTRTSRINALRGFCREFGIAIPVGARTGIEVISRVLADPAMVAATSGDVSHFKDARHFASWFGLTPREHSSVCGVRRWALDVRSRTNHNKAACALANKMARICYATLRDKAPFAEGTNLARKMNRQAHMMPA